MQIITLSPHSRQKCVECWQQGGVIAHPTDTCFGFAADITNTAAVSKISKIKQMAESKPMSILVSDVEMLQQYGKTSQLAEDIIENYLPGALTLLLPKTIHVPARYFPSSELIGLRIPDLPWLLELVKEFGNPVTTTSANITTQMEPYSAQEIFEMFQDEEFQPDLILDIPSSTEKKKPSTIVKVVEDKMEIIRQGDLVIN